MPAVIIGRTRGKRDELIFRQCYIEITDPVAFACRAAWAAVCSVYLSAPDSRTCSSSVYACTGSSIGLCMVAEAKHTCQGHYLAGVWLLGSAGLLILLDTSEMPPPPSMRHPEESAGMMPIHT